MSTQTIHGPGGIKLILDASQIVPDDPGQGTPALVELGNATGTYSCASCEGELCGGPRIVQLTEEQCRWLNDQEDLVTDFLLKHGG